MYSILYYVLSNSYRSFNNHTEIYQIYKINYLKTESPDVFYLIYMFDISVGTIFRSNNTQL